MIDYNHGRVSTVPHPEVALPAGSFCDVHAASLGLQVLVEWLVQDEAVYQAAAHKQVCILPMNVEGDILPLRVGQIHFLKLNCVLGAVHRVHQVQRVGPSIGHDLKLPLAVRALEADQGAPRGAVLSYASHEHKTLVVLHLSKDLFQYGGADRGQVVKADEAVCRGIRIWAPELFGTQCLAGDVADFEQVKRCLVFLFTIYRANKRKNTFCNKFAFFRKTTNKILFASHVY